MKKQNRSSAALVVIALWAAACTDSPTESVKKKESDDLGRTANAQIAVLTCVASKTKLSVTCAPPQISKAAGISGNIIYGGQNTFVTVTSSNVAYNSGTGRFTFDVTLKNLLTQPIGTVDGTTLDPGGIKIFFVMEPTVTGGSGTAAVVPDGFGTFTAGGQPYYQYDYLLADNAVSPAKGWTFIIAPTVTTFSFLLYISAPVEYPIGYILINDELPGEDYGLLHPGVSTALTGLVVNQLGIPIPGATITWGTTDPNQASVDPVTGVVTAIRYGTPAITATSGALNGAMNFDITGTQRTWNGSASTDWENVANWNGGYTPALADTAIVPTGVPNFPALTAAVSTGSIQVADAATITLGAFNLTLGRDAFTGQSAGGVVGTTGKLILAGSAAYLGGRFSLVDVTGSYTTANDVRVTAPISMISGLLTTTNFLTWIVAQ